MADITIRTNPRQARKYKIGMWLGPVFFAFMLFGYLAPSSDEPSHITTGSLLGFALGCALWTLFWWYLAKKTNRRAELEGQLLSFTEDGFQAQRWTIDLSKITEITADFYDSPRHARYGHPRTIPYWRVTSSDGTNQTLEFNYYDQTDRDLFLPILTALLQRPDLVLKGGDKLSRSLEVWFGDKAPGVVAPVQSA